MESSCSNSNHVAAANNSNDQHRPSKRIRTPTKTYSAEPANDSLSREEQRMLAQAISNSEKDLNIDPEQLTSIPFGPTFYPTVEEFNGDPLLYLATIRAEAEKYGICKIVPPKGWNPPFALNVDNPMKFQTKDQSIHRLQEGISFGDGDDYTLKEYQKMASEWSKEWKRRYYSAPSSANPNTETFDVVGDSNSHISLTSDKLESAECVVSYSPKAEETAPAHPIMTPESLERDYWDIVETQRLDVDVDYGNDVDTTEFGSGFPISERGRSVNSATFLAHGQSSVGGDDDQESLPEPEFGTEEFYKETYWNLNNIPNSKNSALRHLKVGINGINVPWLYFGSLFTTFCWHNEDNYMNSINYHHKGAPKQWYGVPGTKHDADGVERVFKSYLSMKMRDVPDLLHHITTSFSPRLLNKEGVRVCKILQHEGEFIVTFPRAFHAGFSLGPNCGEAVNFADTNWMPHAADANERYRTFGRPSVFSHDRLVFTMAHHINEVNTKESCIAVAQELRRLMNEELLLRQKLISAGVRDVSGDVQLPPNRLDQLDEESADYDDKRLCHSCKHICFFSAVCCECSENKVSCLRHSHYMCRCSLRRKYILIWTPESEMRETIERVETRGNELEAAEYPHTAFCHKEKLEDAPSSLKDRIIHQTYEVPVRPMIPIVPEPEPSLHLDISTHKTVSEAEDTNVSEAEDTNVSEEKDKAAQMIEETRSANILTPEVIPVASSVDGALSDGDVSA